MDLRPLPVILLYARRINPRRHSLTNQPSEIAAYVRQNPSVRLGIDGSTDLLRGTNQYNAGRSQRRIAIGRDARIQAGVAADRIETGTFAAQRAGCNDSIERSAQRDGRVGATHVLWLVRPLVRGQSG